MAADLLPFFIYSVLLRQVAGALSIKDVPACKQDCSEQLEIFQTQLLLAVKQTCGSDVCSSSSECDEKVKSLKKKLAKTEARLEHVIRFLNFTSGYTGQEDGNEFSAINICVHLILGGRTDETAVRNCEDVPDHSFKQIIRNAYSSRVENFQPVFRFLKHVKSPRQLAGMAFLLEAMKESRQTSTAEMLQLAHRIHDTEQQKLNGTTAWCTEEQRLLSELKAGLPDSIRQLFWADWCIILNHNLPREYVYADYDFLIDEQGYRRMFTWTQGDGSTLDIGYWNLQPHLGEGSEGSITFRMTNRYHQGLYLAQVTNEAAGRHGCDPRHVHGIRGEAENENVARNWELEPAFNVCEECFYVKNSAFGASEYLYAPNNVKFDPFRRHSLTAEIECTDVHNNNVWEVMCVSGDERISLV